MKLLLLFLFIGFTPNPQVTGTWKASSNGETINLILKADGTGSLDNEPFKYVVQESVLVVTTPTEILKYQFTLNANTLKISGGDLDETITFTRVS